MLKLEIFGMTLAN